MKKLSLVSVVMLCACGNNSSSGLAVKITSPSGTVRTRGTVEFSVTVENGPADSVELLDGDTVLASLTAPYAYSWDTASVTEGEHPVAARAKKGGASVSSSTVRVVVDRTPPSLVYRDPGNIDARPDQLIRLAFNEAVQLGAQTKLTVTAPGASPTVGPLTPAEEGTQIIATLNGAGPVPNTLTLTLSGITDVAGNAMEQITWTASLPIWATVAPSTALGNFGSQFALDSKNLPAVIWRRSDPALAPLVERFDGVAWQKLGGEAGIGSTLGVPGQQQPMGIAFDGEDALYVAVAEGSAGERQLPVDLNVYTWVNNAWLRVGNAPVEAEGRTPRGVTLQRGPDGKVWLAFGENNADNTQTTLRFFKQASAAGAAFVQAAPDLPAGGLIEQRGLAGPFLAFGPGNQVAVAWSSQATAMSNNIGHVAKLETMAPGALSWTTLPDVGHGVPVLTGQNTMVTGVGIPADGNPIVGFAEVVGYVWRWNGTAWDKWSGLSKEVGFTAGPIVVNDAGKTVAILKDPGGGVLALAHEGSEWKPLGRAINEKITENVLVAQPVLDSQGTLVVGLREMPRGDFNSQRFVLRRLNLTNEMVSGLPARTATTCTIATTPPLSIAQTGCYKDVAAHIPADGLIPYALNTSLWSDGAGKRRFIVLPPQMSMTYYPSGAWGVPVGTILMKEFYLPTTLGTPTATLMETRFLVKRDASTWEGYSYQWNTAGTAATLLDNQATLDVKWDQGNGAQHTHSYPSRADCLFCHNAAAGRVLGLQTPLMNRWFDYTPYGGNTDNQIATLTSIGALTGASGMGLPAKAATWFDEDAPLEQRARAYFHANCAHCHRAGGIWPAIKFEFEAPLAANNICNKLDVGNHVDSVIYIRDSIRAVAGQPPPFPTPMPPLATHLKDEIWLSTLARWIDGMATCP